MDPWASASKVLGDGLIQILIENGVEPLSENKVRIRQGAEQFVNAIRSGVQKELQNSRE